MVDLAALPSFIKICGVRSVRDAQLVVGANATALGVILAESRRRVTLAEARDIAESVDGRILVVGVFRDSGPELIVRALESVHLDVVQIHGELADDVLSEVRSRDVGIIKALPIGSREFLEFDESTVDAVLVDGPVPGSGTVHSWRALQHRTFERPVIAAGGLTPSNVLDVLASTGAWGVDVATGVETATGAKDPKLVLDFVTTAQRHFDQREESGD